MVRKPALRFNPEILLTKTESRQYILEFQDKQIVFSQGDVAEAVLYIQKGKVKLTVVSNRGKQAVIAILEPGRFFGEGSLVGGHPLYMMTATSMGCSTVVRLEKPTIARLLREEPEFTEIFIAHLVARNNRVQEDLVDLLFNTVEKRLARALLLLANFGKENQQQVVIPKISQETLAQMIGADRSRVSLLMNKFKRLGFIDYNGELRVYSSLLNVILHD